MNIIRKWGLSVLVSTIMVFFINSMMPFFATYNHQDISLINPNETILICHGDGFSLGTKEDISTKTHSDYQCPSCYVSAHGIKNLSLTCNLPVFYQAFLEKPPVILNQPFFITGLLSHDYIDSHAPPALA